MQRHLLDKETECQAKESPPHICLLVTPQRPWDSKDYPGHSYTSAQGATALSSIKPVWGLVPTQA